MSNTVIDQYGVMGNPIAHSKSPQIHAMFAHQTGQAMNYSAILVPLGELAQALDKFQAEGGRGLNITVPFKHEAWRLVHERSDRAWRAQAVNTIVFRPDGQRYGDTTDGVGLVRDLAQNHGVELRRKRILIMGAGGAVAGVVGPLLAESPAELVMANRAVTKALELVKQFDGLGPLRACSYTELQGLQFDVIINGTSASLQNQLPPLPERVLAAGAVCYDMMYGAEPTAFVRWAQEQGAELALDGLGMLVEQAAEAFYLWRGVRPHTAPVIVALRD